MSNANNDLMLITVSLAFDAKAGTRPSGCLALGETFNASDAEATAGYLETLAAAVRKREVFGFMQKRSTRR